NSGGTREGATQHRRRVVSFIRQYGHYFALYEGIPGESLIQHRVASRPGMLVGKHFQPLLVHGLFEGFVLCPHDNFDDVFYRTAGGIHHSADVFEHELALSVNIGWSTSRFRFHTEYSVKHHEWNNEAANRNGVLLQKSRHFKTATFAHLRFS